MYKTPQFHKTQISVNTSKEGETIEQKMERVLNNNEAIKDGAPLIYTERSEGVKQAFNIRTDRWEIAVDGMDKVSKSVLARREERAKAKETKVIDLNQDGKAESTGGTNN